MADTVLYQTDDDLSQANLASTAKRQNAEDYVERGLSLSNYDSTGLTVDVSAGHCVIDAGTNAAYDVFPDARTGVSLTDNTTNSVFVVIDPTVQDDVSVTALDSGTPANPHLKIGEVDTSADTTTDVARDPSASYESLSTDETHSKDSLASATIYVENGTVKASGRRQRIDSGSDIGAIFNAVVDSLPAGSHIEIQDGDYTTSTALQNLSKTGFTVEGGGDAYIKLAGGNQKNIFDLQGADGWTIRGLELDGNGSNQTDPGDRGTNVGIYAIESDNLLIENNEIYGTIYSTIRIPSKTVNVYNNRVLNNYVHDNIGGSDQADDLISFAGQSNNVGFAVRGNICENCAHQSIEISQNGMKGEVSNNIVRSATDSGIVVHYGRKVNVTDNIVVDTKNGIEMANDGSVSDNVVIGARNKGIANVTYGASIENNEVYDTTDRGIDTTVDDAVVKGNLVDGTTNEMGIYVTGARSEVKNNTVQNCGNWGIRHDKGSLVAISGNKVYNNTSQGIQLGGTNSPSKVKVADNELISNGSQGIGIESGLVDVKLGTENVFDANSLGKLYNNGTRTRWGGVIGGGPLGGVDLGSITGQFTGDKALSNGTTAATAYLEATWDGAQWVLSDGSTV